MAGFIKLFRDINTNEILANDNNSFVVFIRLLTLVNRHTGSYTTGRKKLAVYMNLKESTLYDVLKRLERASMIRLDSSKYATTIHICNWWDYQQDTNGKPTIARQNTDTKQEREKKKKVYIKRKCSEGDALNALNEATGRNFRSFPTRAEKTLTLYTVDEIREALKKMVRDEWHKPKIATLSSDYMLSKPVIERFFTAQDSTDKYVKSYGAKQTRVSSDKLNLSRKELAELEYQEMETHV